MDQVMDARMGKG